MCAWLEKSKAVIPWCSIKKMFLRILQISQKKIYSGDFDARDFLCILNIFTAKIFRIILNGKTLLYSGLSWIFQRQYRDKNNSSYFIWSSVKSSLTRWESKNAHGEGWRLTWTMRTEAFYKLLTWTRLENNFRCILQNF